MRLFHYHLVTHRIRDVEARYIAKLGFDLVARHGRIGEDAVSFEAGVPWNELDRMGFKLRLSELERGAVNVVVQPGQWELPRVDHLGFVLDDTDFAATLARAERHDLRIQEHGGRRTFVSTNAGYRLELHPPRDWIDEPFERVRSLLVLELEEALDPVREVGRRKTHAADELPHPLELEAREVEAVQRGEDGQEVEGRLDQDLLAPEERVAHGDLPVDVPERKEAPVALDHRAPQRVGIVRRARPPAPDQLRPVERSSSTARGATSSTTTSPIRRASARR